MSQTMFSAYYSEYFLMNHTQYNTPLNISPHSHDVEELIFLKSGNASYVVDGKTYPLTRNSLIITRPSENHFILFHDGTEYERYNLLFNVGKLQSDIFDSIPSDIAVINFDRNALVEDLFRKMDYYCENFHSAALENILLHLIEEVFYNVVVTLQKTEQSSIYSVNPTLNKAVEYIEQNLAVPLTIDSICKELFISKVYLHQLFLKHMQISPKKYIISKKLMLAQRELRAGKKSTEVYQTCGFSDYSTFYRDYKKHFGYAPSDELNAKVVREIQS